MARIALATCRPLPEPDPDEPLLLDALRGAGHRPELLVWDDPQQPAPRHWDLCVIRSTWDYYRHRDAFVHWAGEMARGTRLLNPAPVLRWNTHKGYLRQLEAAGVPVVPTRFVPRGSEPPLAPLCDELGGEHLVLKPAVSASSYGTRRFWPHQREQAQAYLHRLCRDHEVMVQPYIESVEHWGEHAVVWIDGQLTHAVRKSPRFSGDDEQVSAALPVDAAMRTVAQQALQPWRDQLLYGRVDLVRDAAGALRVAELELVEPSLFLLQHPPALERLVRAMDRRCR